MVIYGELYFIENFITMVLLLIFTGRLVGCKPRVPRLVAASIIGGVCSYSVFLPMTIFESIALRVVMGLGLTYIAFGHKNLLIKTFILFLLTFTSGGMIMAILLWMQESVINYQGFVYMETLTYVKLLAIGTLAFGFTYWFIKLVRSCKIGSSIKGTVTIVVDDETFLFDAFVDSGNSLRDPTDNAPVILIDTKKAKKLHNYCENLKNNFRLIPYRAVGVEFGLLESIKTDKVIFEKRVYKDVRLAFYEGVFDGYDVLLNNDFLEGGLLEKNN